jgi:NADH-quinone oxidoreductase subunit E
MNTNGRIKEIVGNYGDNCDSLISILQDIQTEYHYLPRECLQEVATILNVPLVQVYGVATFFKAFSLKPRGEHVIKVCMGTACHVRNSPSVLDEISRELDLKPGNTSGNMKFTMETVNCLGACALGPIVVIDEKYHGQMSTSKVKKVLSKYVQYTKD